MACGGHSTLLGQAGSNIGSSIKLCCAALFGVGVCMTDKEDVHMLLSAVTWYHNVCTLRQ